MRKLLSLMLLIASVSVFAEARDIKFQKWVNQLSNLDPAKDEDVMEATTIVGHVDDAVDAFARKKVRSVDEYRDLVTLAAYASPFFSFPETAQAILKLKSKSPEMAKAFDEGIAGVDKCRQRSLLAAAKVGGDGSQEGPAAVKRAEPKAGDFDYLKCVADAKSAPKKK